MRGKSWVVIMVVVAGGVSSSAFATKLSAGSRIEAVQQSTPAYGLHLVRTWARNAGGQLVALSDNAGYVSAEWENFGTPNGVAVGTHGVAATSYYDGTAQVEHVYYVGTDGNLYEGVLQSGNLTVTAIPPPTGKTLTGQIAATTFVDGFYGELRFIAATTTDNKLFVYYSEPFSLWLNVSGGLTWSAVKPLAATGNDQHDVISFFGSHIATGGYPDASPHIEAKISAMV